MGTSCENGHPWPIGAPKCPACGTHIKAKGASARNAWLRAAASVLVWAVCFNILGAIVLGALEVSTGYIWFSEPYWLFGTWLTAWVVAGIWIGFMRSWARSKRGTGTWGIGWVRSWAKSAGRGASMDAPEPSAASSDARPSRAPTGRMVPLKSVVIGISVVLAVIAAFGIGMAVDSFELPATDDVSDEEALAEMNESAKDWNEEVGPVLAEYQESDVHSEQWVDEARAATYGMEVALENMEAAADEIADSELRDLTAELVANYDEKLTAMTALVNAVEYENADAEASAWADLEAAAAVARRLVRELIGATS